MLLIVWSKGQQHLISSLRTLRWYVHWMGVGGGTEICVLTNLQNDSVPDKT